VAVSLALGGFGFWALVAQTVTEATAKSAALWVASGWRPALRHPGLPGELDGLVRYSREALGARVLGYVSNNADLLLVGLVLGPTALGLYSRAYQWASFPMLHVYGALLSVLIATLSQSRDTPQLFRDHSRRLILPIFALCLPALALMVVEAEAVVLVLLGEQWRAATPLLRIFALSAMAASLLQIVKAVNLALGRTDRQLRWTATTAPIFVLAALVGVRWEALGVALAFAGTTLLLAPIGVAYGLRGGPLGARDLAGIAAYPALAACVAACALWAIGPLLHGLAPLPRLVVGGGWFGLCYGLCWACVPSGRAAVRGWLAVGNS
jgi:PST family polysaccharide transporter